jgi:F-box-like
MAATSILHLPNETLSAIFSYFPIFPLGHPSDCWPTQPVLAVRQVCRRFRTVVNELSFWYQDEFQPDLPNMALIGCSQHQFKEKFYRREKFFKALLADRHLAHCLGRKTSWRFRSFHIFVVVFEQIPLFRRSVTKIQYYRTPFDLFTKSETVGFMTRIGLCTQLTTLRIAHVPYLDWDHFLKFCPGLQALTIDDRNSWQVLVLDRERGSTLEGLANLQKLSLVEPRTLTTSAGVSILPLSSVASLSHLHLKNASEADTEHAAGLLHNFVYLTSLHLTGLSEDICDHIIRSSFRLISFAFEIQYCSVAKNLSAVKLEEMFAARCLEGVEELKFASAGGIWYAKNDQSSIIGAITNLLSLQNLEMINVALPDIHWCPSFSRLVNLRSILWKTPSVSDGYEDLYPRDLNHVEEAFETAFACFVEKPSLNIEIEYDYEANLSDSQDDDWV